MTSVSNNFSRDKDLSASRCEFDAVRDQIEEGLPTGALVRDKLQASPRGPDELDARAPASRARHVMARGHPLAEIERPAQNFGPAPPEPRQRQHKGDGR